VTRPHFCAESPIDASTPSSRNSFGLLPLPLDISPIITVEPSAPHLHELHDHSTRQITISNYNFQSGIESHKRLQDLTIGDEVLIRLYPEKFPLGTLKRLDSSAYELDISHDLGISLVFNVEDLTRYYTFTRPQWFSIHPLQPPLLRRSATENFV